MTFDAPFVYSNADGNLSRTGTVSGNSPAPDNNSQLYTVTLTQTYKDNKFKSVSYKGIGSATTSTDDSYATLNLDSFMNVNYAPQSITLPDTTKYQAVSSIDDSELLYYVDQKY